MALDTRKVIFLTGATGNMGSATLAELLSRSDRFIVRALVRPEEKNHPVVRRHAKAPGLEWVWGDLTRYEDVVQGVNGADQVLHIGGLVSPLADQKTRPTAKVDAAASEGIRTMPAIVPTKGTDFMTEPMPVAVTATGKAPPSNDPSITRMCSLLD